MQEMQLLVFDWDGTLMDSEARIVGCLRAAVLDLGLDDQPDENLKNVIGLGLHEALVQLHPQGTPQEHQYLTERYRYHFLDASDIPSTLFQGTEQMLKEMAGQGYFLAIATGKGRQGLDRVLEETGIGPYFHFTRCADESRSKPHPQMLEEVIEFCGVEPQQTIMIGDTEYDLQMANNVGTHALAVSYGVHEKERLLSCNPVDCVDSVADMHNWLNLRLKRVA